MEASPEPRPSKSDTFFLEQKIIEQHLLSGEPVEFEKARLIWLMNQVIDSPETTDGGW